MSGITYKKGLVSISPKNLTNAAQVQNKLDKSRLRKLVTDADLLHIDNEEIKKTSRERRQSVAERELFAQRDMLEHKLSRAIRGLYNYQKSVVNTARSRLTTANTDPLNTVRLGGGMQEEGWLTERRSVSGSEMGGGLRDLQAIAALNRALYPHYTARDVYHLMQAFNAADTDGRGALTPEQWVHCYQGLQPRASAQEARALFAMLDRRGDGLLQLDELVRAVFDKADAAQRALVVRACGPRDEMAALLTRADVRALFTCYDAGNVGYVRMALFRERAKTFAAGGPATYQFLENLSSIRDEDMLSLEEFLQVLKPYIIKTK
jgi:Ca2+-binding EF-hand superfamily protein